MSHSAVRPDDATRKARQFIVLSGCSGGGKSSLLAELNRRGFVTYEETGRQIVKEQLRSGGDALPWKNADHFLALTIARSVEYLKDAAKGDRIAFFDRGIIDQISGFERRGMEIPPAFRALVECYRYRETVFVVPPWREIFVNDEERRHSFEDALVMYADVVSTYEHFGYRLVTVPKMSVSARAEFVLRHLRS